jgi:hypothetical protein
MWSKVWGSQRPNTMLNNEITKEVLQESDSCFRSMSSNNRLAKTAEPFIHFQHS